MPSRPHNVDGPPPRSTLAWATRGWTTTQMDLGRNVPTQADRADRASPGGRGWMSWPRLALDRLRLAIAGWLPLARLFERGDLKPGRLSDPPVGCSIDAVHAWQDLARRAREHPWRPESDRGGQGPQRPQSPGNSTAAGWSASHRMLPAGCSGGEGSAPAWTDAVLRALGGLVESRIWPRRRVALRDIELLQASSASLAAAADLDAFARECAAPLVADVSTAALAACMRHPEMSPFKDRGTRIRLALYAWDGRIGWRNAGASRQFAALRYLGSRLDLELHVDADVTVHRLDAGALGDLSAIAQAWAICVLSPQAQELLTGALGAMRIDHVIIDAPWISTSSKVLFLRRTCDRIDQARGVLAAAGAQDLVGHWSAALDRQRRLRWPAAERGPLPRSPSTTTTA